jgi:signal transduction histidine kinase
MPISNRRVLFVPSPPRMPEAERRRPDSARGGMHSTLIARLCLILLVAPWLVILCLHDIFAVNGLSTELFFFILCLELATVTLAALALVHSRLADLRAYETRREHERLLFSYARDGMLLVKVGGERASEASFVIQAENPIAVERLGAIGQARSYVGCDIEEAFPRWLSLKLRTEYLACVTSRQMRRYEVCLPDGTVTHESVATPVMDSTDGRVSHLIVIMRDVSDRVLHERELSDALQKAETANRSKSEFLASMSHELRTPLNAVLGFSEAMHAGIGGPLSDKQKEYVDHIHQSGSHLLGIISDILDLSKIEAGQVTLQEQPVDAGQMVESCVLMVRERAAAKQLVLEMDVAPGLPMLKADPLRLKQILINLLSNAIKFTDEGSVTIAADFHPRTGFEFIVSDSGIGMTQDEIELALQPFGQVESAFSRNHEGTGLGLPITRHLAVLHGGSLVLSSTPSLGTQAIVTLPAERALAVPQRAAGA